MPKSANQQAYQKEINRINRFIKNASKRGFIFDREKISEMIPEKGSRITKKKIEILKAITPNVLYKEAKYLDPVTKQIVSGRQGRTLEQKRAGRKGYERRKAKEGGDYQQILDIVRREMQKLLSDNQFAPGHGVLLGFWADLVSEYPDPEIYIRIYKVPEVKDMLSDLNWVSGDDDHAKEIKDEILITLQSVAPMDIERFKQHLQAFSEEVDEEW